MHHWDLSYEAAVLRYIKTWFRIEVEPHGADRHPAIVKLSPHAGVAAPKYPEKGRRSPTIGNVDMALVLESP